MREILGGNGHVLAGIDVLRKICNHPDLAGLPDSEYDYMQEGALLPWQRSAKMVVLENLLKLWHCERS